MAGSCVYRRGSQGVARSLGGALAARRAAAPRWQEDDEEPRGQGTGAALNPDVRRLSSGLQTTQPPAAFSFSSPEHSTIPFVCTCYSLRHRWAPEQDLHVQSFTRVIEEKVSLCLLLSSRGGHQKTVVEEPRSALAHLDQMLAEQVARGLSLLGQTRSRAVQKKASLCSPLESIAGSITTVDAQRQDDIAEGQWSLQTEGLYVLEASKLSTWHLNSGGTPVWHLNATNLSAWHLNGGDLDSFRTLFDHRFCRMPYLAGFSSSDYGCLLDGSLLAFQTKDRTQARNSPNKNDPEMEEHLAVMYERLRREIPNFFQKRHDYSMYKLDMEFENGILNMKTRGRPMYQAVLTVFRFLAWNYFADVHMEVLKLTQHPENWSIQARWRVTGLPFHMLLLRFYRKDKAELYRCYDAHSTFYLGPDGLIRYHKVDKLMPAQPPVVKSKRLLAGLLVVLGMAEDRPALNLLLCRTGRKHC